MIAGGAELMPDFACDGVAPRADDGDFAVVDVHDGGTPGERGDVLAEFLAEHCSQTQNRVVWRFISESHKSQSGESVLGKLDDELTV